MRELLCTPWGAVRGKLRTRYLRQCLHEWEFRGTADWKHALSAWKQFAVGRSILEKHAVTSVESSVSRPTFRRARRYNITGV